MRLAPLVFLLGLGACGTVSGPRPDVIKDTLVVHVPTPVSCVPEDTPAAPTYPDTRVTLLAAPDPVARARLVESGWGLRDTRLAFLEGVLTACRDAAPAPPAPP